MDPGGSAGCHLFHFRRSRIGRRITRPESIKNEFFSSWRGNSVSSFGKHEQSKWNSTVGISPKHQVAKLSNFRNTTSKTNGKVINELKGKARKCYGHHLSCWKDGYFGRDEDKALEKSAKVYGKRSVMRKEVQGFSLCGGQRLWLTLFMAVYFLLAVCATDIDGKSVKLRHAASETKTANGRLMKFSLPPAKIRQDNGALEENHNYGRQSKQREVAAVDNSEVNKSTVKTLLSLLAHEEKRLTDSLWAQPGERSREKRNRSHSKTVLDNTQRNSMATGRNDNDGDRYHNHQQSDSFNRSHHQKNSQHQTDLHNSPTDKSDSKVTQKTTHHHGQHYTPRDGGSRSTGREEIRRDANGIQSNKLVESNTSSGDVQVHFQQDGRLNSEPDGRLSSSSNPPHLENFKQSLKVSHNKKHGPKLSLKPAKKQEKVSRNPKERHHVSKKTRQNKARRKRTEGVPTQLPASQTLLESNQQRLAITSTSMKSKARQEIDGTKVTQLAGQLDFLGGKRKAKSTKESKEFAEKKYSRDKVERPSEHKVELSASINSDHESNTGEKHRQLNNLTGKEQQIKVPNSGSDQHQRNLNSYHQRFTAKNLLTSNANLKKKMEHFMHSVYDDIPNVKLSLENPKHSNSKHKRQHKTPEQKYNDSKREHKSTSLPDRNKNDPHDVSDVFAMRMADNVVKQNTKTDGDIPAQVSQTQKKNDVKTKADVKESTSDKKNSRVSSGDSSRNVKKNVGEDIEGYQSDQGRHIYSTPLTSRLELRNGLYHGLTVAVTSRVSPEHCRDVIEGLKVSQSSLYFTTLSMSRFTTKSELEFK